MSGKFNFDLIVDRKGTNSLKTEKLKERYGNGDLIPLWVADMDFLSPPQIAEAIIERAKHGIFGYTFAPQEYYDSIKNWLERRHNWQIDQEWLSFIPGVVKGIAFITECFTSENDTIVIQPPIYPPFKSVPTMHQRKVVTNPLVLKNGRYEMDFEQLKDIIRTTNPKIFILCNPHNPGGRVWNQEDLIELSEICHDNNVLVISDEIHADLALYGNKHIPFASVSEKAAQNSITLMAPSKTFNIAGIISSFSIIPNKEIRDKFHSYLTKSELSEAHIFACTATTAAYNYGDAWLDGMKQYLEQNIDFVDKYCKQNIPQIKVMKPDASFLIWLDCRSLNLSQKELEHLFINNAHLALNSGSTFGIEGEGFMRMNIGCPLSILEKAMSNLEKALK